MSFTTTSGPVLQKKLDLTGILSNIRLRQVFFIDEIHRLMPDVEEMLYSALEDFPRRHSDRRRTGSAHALHADAEVHRRRRNHAAGFGERAIARTLRTGVAARSLPRRRN